jgi:transglutaminase-like putative cysteine protease
VTAAVIPVRTVWLLLAGYLGAVVLNAHHTALWCLPLALGTVIWRARRAQTPPGKSRHLARAAVIVVLTGAVLLGFRTLNGVQAGASLLVAMAALKLTETSAARDWQIVVGASLFLLLAACLDAQMLWRLPLYAAELWLLCMGMYALGARHELPPLRTLMQRTSRSLLAAMPFAILLFLFVPRLAGSFWALPQQHEAITGLSDEMNPGNISSLSESGDSAARVRFEGPLPPPEQRYWRGFVLDGFDGNTWRRSRRGYGHATALVFSGTPYRYVVSLEPSQLTVLLALELPRDAPADLPSAHLSDDYQLINAQPVAQRMSYRLESFPQHHSPAAQQLSPEERQRNLRFPAWLNVRSIELARTLRARADSDLSYIGSVLDYFRRGFKYTLDPELSNVNSVDDLLFNTHEGFCGHYASAFAQLMRAAGIPARVVTGYQGGIWNRYGNYLLIRQSDAHAWTEVWLEGEGWVRIDPTAVVAPGRLTQGSDLLSVDGATLAQRMYRYAWIANTAQVWQAVNAWWQDEFVGFNSSKQQGLLEHLGIDRHYLRSLALILAIGGSIWLGAIAWSLRPRQSRRADDALSRAWRALERKLRHAAPARAPHEGPVAYAERIARQRPELAAMVIALARRFATLRYGPQASSEELQQFRRAVRLWRPAPAPARPVR